MKKGYTLKAYHENFDVQIKQSTMDSAQLCLLGGQLQYSYNHLNHGLWKKPRDSEENSPMYMNIAVHFNSLYYHSIIEYFSQLGFSVKYFK